MSERDADGARRVLQEMALRQELCLSADEPCGSDGCSVCIGRAMYENGWDW